MDRQYNVAVFVGKHIQLQTRSLLCYDRDRYTYFGPFNYKLLAKIVVFIMNRIIIYNCHFCCLFQI